MASTAFLDRASRVNLRHGTSVQLDRLPIELTNLVVDNLVVSRTLRALPYTSDPRASLVREAQSLLLVGKKFLTVLLSLPSFSALRLSAILSSSRGPELLQLLSPARSSNHRRCPGSHDIHLESYPEAPERHQKLPCETNLFESDSVWAGTPSCLPGYTQGEQAALHPPDALLLSSAWVRALDLRHFTNSQDCQTGGEPGTPAEYQAGTNRQAGSARWGPGDQERRGIDQQEGEVQGKEELPGLCTLVQHCMGLLYLVVPRWYTDTHLASLSGLSALRTLVLSGSSVTDAGLKQLAGLRELRELNLSHCEGLFGVGLSHLRELRSLGTLDLSFCHLLNDSCAPFIGRLSGLQCLDLAGTMISDETLCCLGPLMWLRKLSLTHCELVTNEGLEVVTRLLLRNEARMLQLQHGWGSCFLLSFLSSTGSMS